MDVVNYSDPETRTALIKYISEFLLDPVPLFWACEENRCVILRECASQVYAHLCELVHDSSIEKTNLFSCIHVMHSSYQALLSEANGKKESNEELLKDMKRKFENSVSSISHLTNVLKPKETIEIAIPALARRLEESSSEHRDILWYALGNIGMTSDMEIFRTILSFLLNDYGTSGMIPKISHTLARMPGRPMALSVFMLERVLQILLEKGSLLHKTSQVIYLLQVKDLCNLVRVILETEGISEQIVNNPELAHSFRNMWFYVVLFVLGPNGSWPKEWVSTLKSIARKCPPLILDKTARNLEVNLGSDSILVATFPESITNKIRLLLASYIPTKSNEAKTISWPVAVYMLTVYHVEFARNKSLNLEYLWGYLVDDRFQGGDLYPLMECIVDTILQSVINEPSLKKKSNEVSESIFKTLLVYAGHRLSNIRKFSARWITNFLIIFPQMHFYRPLVSFMLDLSRYLDNQKAGHVEDHLQFDHLLNFLSVQEAHESASDYFSVCKEWISSALNISPTEFIPILQNYINDISSVSPWIGSRQSRSGNSEDDISSSFLLALFQTFYADTSTSANMIRHSSKRVRTLGEVGGLLSSMESKGSDAHYLLSKEFAKDLRKLYRDPEDPHFSTLLYECIGKCAALVILNTQKVESELLLLICYASQVQFSTAVVEIVLETLAWVMSTKPSLVNRILANLFQSWEAISLKRLGIYSQGPINDPFAGEMTYGAPLSRKDDFSCEPHAIWITFFVERFRYDRLQCSDTVILYSSFVRMATNRVHVMR